jgi:hypothetical protein
MLFKQNDIFVFFLRRKTINLKNKSYPEQTGSPGPDNHKFWQTLSRLGACGLLE